MRRVVSERCLDAADITIYWGSAADFLRELKTRLAAP